MGKDDITRAYPSIIYNKATRYESNHIIAATEDRIRYGLHRDIHRRLQEDGLAAPDGADGTPYPTPH